MHGDVTTAGQCQLGGIATGVIDNMTISIAGLTTAASYQSHVV